MPKLTPAPKKAGGFLSLVMKIILVLMVLYAVGKIVAIRIEIERADERLKELSVQADLAERELGKKEQIAKREPTDEDYLDAAHSSGYILPGERIFEDPIRAR